jgi:hypothetical protein
LFFGGRLIIILPIAKKADKSSKILHPDSRQLLFETVVKFFVCGPVHIQGRREFFYCDIFNQPDGPYARFGPLNHPSQVPRTGMAAGMNADRD